MSPVAGRASEEATEMPYKVKKVGKGKVRVTSPHGVKAKATTPAKAQKQVNLLRGVEHGWRPTGRPAKKKTA